MNLLKEKEQKKRYAVFDIIDMLPGGMAREIERLCKNRRDFPIALSELRVKYRGRSSLTISGDIIPLFYDVRREEMDELFDRVTGGSLYAHENELSEGFISLFGGVRVGVLGGMRQREGVPSETVGLVFRIPSGGCSFAKELTEIYKRKAETGMLIYSKPGAGKTTALRALALNIAEELRRKVVIVDERREFIPEDYKDSTVDVLLGYTKAKGSEIALRTLGAEVIIVDEIGNTDEAEALLRVGRGGVPLIASAHGGSLEEIISKECIAPLIKEGYFGSFILLWREGGRFFYKEEKIV